MAKRNLKPRWSLSDFLRSKLFLVGATALLGLISLSLVKEFYRKVEVNQDIEALQTEIQTLEKQNSELSLLIQRMNSDLWQEKEARTKLGLAEEGEIVVAIPPEEQGRVPTSIETILANQQEAKKSNLTKWWEYFFDSFEI